MRKNRWISLVVAVLLVVSAFSVYFFKDHKAATKELLQDLNVVNTSVGSDSNASATDSAIVATSDEVNEAELKDLNFVSGSKASDPDVLKAEKKAENNDDDFIVTAIGNKIKASKTKPTVVTSDGQAIDGFDLPSGTKDKDQKNDDSAKPSEPETKTETPDVNAPEESKPEEVVDPGTVPFDIAEPEVFESGEVEYVDNQILIKFKKSFDGKVDSVLKSIGIGKLEPMFSLESGDWYVGYLLKSADINATMESVREMNNVIVAEYNFKSEAASIDTDPLSDAVTANEMADQQWVLKSCGIQSSWDYLEEKGLNPGGSSSITVAVIDTGVDYEHKDLKHNIWTNSGEVPDNNIDDDGNGYVDDYYGIDMTANMGSGMDDHGHGTHVAGIIAAENNDIGVVGIAYNTKIMPVKAGDASGYFLQDNIANAIMYAYNQGADVINMSFGGGASSIAVSDALEVAYSRCVLVAAAGNSGAPNEPTDSYPVPAPNFPGDYKYVLGVMSSDNNDVESGFTCWDARRYNNNEYEVYAPGNEILSTIPGDRYASLSGTSMASPVVAAQAALLRSMFNDPDTYPTKFIYGQISGTAENTITCCNPRLHTVGGMLHNIPGRVNFENSLKTMPRPELSVSEYRTFDTEGFSNDTEGIAAEAAEANNGDGIIDSGEVIALGFTLRNRWGMSSDAVVSIDATNDLGVTNPYVTFLNNDINYGSVGTYSEQDAGKIMTGDKWTGWEKPFYIKIADNCPNDYTITLNVSIESRNGLDESDTGIYRGKAAMTLVVRNGVILPNKITEDMTLTSDNYYIIPNSMIIMEGATVTVEPGTQIQFWTNNPQDAYADTAITYLKVQGQLLCKGTEEEPIEMFPSGWMDRYRVEIYKSDNGFVSMDYTNITNPYLTIDRAENCTFTQNYSNSYIYYRWLNGGNIINSMSNGEISINDAKYCAFYKLGNYRLSQGKYSSCIFVDSAVDLNNSCKFINCVFYGNNTKADGSTDGNVSSLHVYQNDISFTGKTIVYDDINDKYYISLNDDFNRSSREGISNNYAPQRISTYDFFAKQMGGAIATINTNEEYSFIKTKLQMENENSDYWCGIHKSDYGKALNYDDTKLPQIIPIKNGKLYFAPLNKGEIIFDSSDSKDHINKYLLEVPGNGLATEISLDKYVVHMETGNTHQIETTIKPVTVEQSDLIFTSEDESIATVDQNGLITAVAPGTTQVKVYSQDLAIYNYVTVNVSDYVGLEEIGVSKDELQINIGETKKIKPVFTPANTTRTAVTYTSSDDSIASVSPKGVVTAISEGDAIITLTGENDCTAYVKVHAVIPIESISFTRDFYETNPNIKPTGHTEEVLPGVAATCTETGLTEGKKCATCEEILVEQEIVPATGHTWNGGEIITEATCNDSGTKLFTCENCGETREETITALGHNWGEWTRTIEPTGTEEGLEVRTCQNDTSHTEERVVPNLNHVHDLVKVDAVDPTCTENGNIEYWTCNDCHINFSDAEGNNEITGDVVIKATGHTEETVPGVDPTCTETGLTESIICSVCGKTLIREEPIEATGHSWNEGVVTIEPTCEEEGEMLFTCEVCGETKTEVIDAIGHDWGAWDMKYEPTSNEEGLQIRRCWNDWTHKETRTVANLNHSHNLEKVEAVPATCTEVGTDEYWTCTECYKEFSDSEGINEIIDEDAIVTHPEILPISATNKTLIWESTDPDICTVEKGKLIKNSTGIVTLRATVQDTNLSDEITVLITDKTVNPVAVKTVKADDWGNIYAITEAGEVFVWGNGITRPTKLAFENVEDAYLIGNTLSYSSSNIAYILDKDCNVSKYHFDLNSITKDDTFGTLRNIKSFASNNTIRDSYHAIDKNGNVWAWGRNNYGQLGDGSEKDRDIAVQIEFENEITKIIDQYGNSAYLDKENNLYVTGGESHCKTPVLEATSVNDVYSFGFNSFTSYDLGNTVVTFYNNLSSKQYYTKEHSEEKAMAINAYYFYIDNGIPYMKGNNSHGRMGIGNTDFSDIFVPMVGVTDVKDVITIGDDRSFIITNDGHLYGTGNNASGELGIGNTDRSLVPVQLYFFSNDYSTDQLTMVNWNASHNIITSDGTIELSFNMPIKAAEDYSQITLTDNTSGEVIAISKKINMNKLTIKPKSELMDSDDPCYTLSIPQTALMSIMNGQLSEEINLSFGYHNSESEIIPGDDTEEPQEGQLEDPDAVHEIVTDDELFSQRENITSESLQAAWEQYCGLNVNAYFYSNVILNRLNDDDTSGWLRITTYESDNYQTIDLGQNYWGTTDEELINKQILDFDDYQSLMDIDESNYLTEAPSDTFPFVTQAYLTVNGGKVDTVGNEEVTFVVDFNRPMDTSIDLDVKFGSSYPYAEYTIPGEYVTDTEWQGTVTLTTLIENGYQYFSVSNGKAAGTSLKLYKDWGRFPFKIDTASAQSLLMQGTATENGIALSWSQDDFETLAGYNVYRSDAEDGLYQRINKTVIPADTKEFLDDTVEPGVKYYYNFTVVQSDMTESEPSGKVQVTSLDTMAPDIYHSQVTTAYKGSNLVISATIIDNVAVEKATLFYRVAGTDEWKSRTMDKNNDKYSAVINSSFLTDDGLEYYIEAFDGKEYKYEGTANEPFFVEVKEAVSASDLGDVDGNGVIELKDAMMILMAVNDRYNMTEDEFRRADLDGDLELSASEALRIIYYINGTISSLF